VSAARRPAGRASGPCRRALPLRWGWPSALALALGACHTAAARVAPGTGQAGESAAAAAPAAAEGAGPLATPARASCDGAGPLASPEPPLALAELCSGERARSVVRLPTTRQFEGLHAACDPDRVPGASHGAFTAPEPAPAGSGLAALRVLNTVAVDDVGMIHFGASYLVAERSGGVCLVDIVHEWAARPSYVETGLSARWEETATGQRVRLASERVMHEPLDDTEFAAGVSDVRSEDCVLVVYHVSEGSLSRVEQAASPGACSPE